MSTNPKNIKQALNPAFLKQPISRDEIELFKSEVISFFKRINTEESEEFHKNLIKDFLNAVYYKDKHYINTKGKNDLVIHNGAETASPVGVLIETKSPANKSEMPRLLGDFENSGVDECSSDLNVKSFHELVLYYLRERKTGKNFELRYLIITNVFEWFIFDAQDFEKLFYQNKTFLNLFEQFQAGKLSGTTTDFFYKEIASPEIARLTSQNPMKNNEIVETSESNDNGIPFTYLNLRDYEKIINSNDKEDERKLVALYKFLSPTHLLKLPFANDNNQLNKEFYAELLHIIGLEEIMQDGKKLIVRKKDKERDSGSIIENAIERITVKNKWNNYNFDIQDIESLQFEIALDLTITWINRILFLKLLESQILKYQNGNKDYSFLSPEKINRYIDLDTLFFSVLSRQEHERQEDINQKFKNVPYLNSSLFEITDTENKTICIDSLLDNITIELYSKSVLHSNETMDFVNTARLNPLEYLLRFLDAYDFSSEGSEDIQDVNKPLISAAVLGLIFEKINGYKDGSFFTPSFITMYMCHESINQAIIQKFNATKRWNCKTINDLYNKIDDIAEANKIFNSIRICDPAVGSGHFLVSALNEMIFLKSELGILSDKNGKRLKDYRVMVENDELIIIDNEGNYFNYNPKNIESQRVQETFFHEKQIIIENCLFGVDINPNSVKICQLRLWIELLKHAYYSNVVTNNYLSLQTFPNIDINIKCGNSLMSRFALNDKYMDNPALQQKIRQATKRYKEWVYLYKECNDKEAKRQITKNIETEKDFFYRLNNANDADYANLQKVKYELELHRQSFNFFETETDEWQNKTTELTEKLTNFEKIYNDKVRGCFEWRFEFPEVLDEDGNYMGFDVVMGNPPYIMLSPNDFKNYEFTLGNNNTYVAFNELSIRILSINGLFTLIEPTTWFSGNKFEIFRTEILTKYNLKYILQLPYDIFKEAYVDTAIVVISKEKPEINTHYYKFNIRDTHKIDNLNFTEFPKVEWLKLGKIFLSKDLLLISKKIWLSEKNIKLGEISKINRGCLPPKENEISKKKTHFYNIKWFNNQVFRYTIIKQGEDEFVNFKSLRENKPIYLYQTKKILARQLMSRQFRMNLTYIDEEFAFKKNLYVIFDLNEEFDYKYVLAVLNSKLFSFMQVNFNASLQRDDFPAFSLKDFREFLIPVISKENQQPFIDLVKKILSAKKSNPETDTSKLEREIDELVYGLYGLTDEEIEIIDRNKQHA